MNSNTFVLNLTAYDLKEKLSGFLKSAVLATDVYFVNNKEKDFCGFIIDEDVLPSVSYFVIGGYQENAPDEVVGIKIKTLQKCLKFDDVKAINFNNTYLECVFEDKAEIEVAYIYVDKDKQVIENLIDEALAFAGVDPIITIPEDKAKFALKHLMIPRTNYKIGGYEVAVIDKDKKAIIFGNNNHIVITPEIFDDNLPENINFHSSLLNKTSGYVNGEVKIYKKDSAIKIQVDNNFFYIGAEVDVDMPNYSAVLESETKSIIDLGDNLSSAISGLEKLSIPLMTQDDKIITVKETDKKSFVKFSVEDISGLESYVIISAMITKNSEEVINYSLFEEPFEKVIKSSASIILDEREVAIIMESKSVDGFGATHILPKVMV